MTIIKSYTDIEQSKKLAEILPLESADMGYDGIEDRVSRIIRYTRIATTMPNMNSIPCWSLAALLSVLPFHLITNNQRYAFNMHKGLDKDGETYMFRYNVFNTDVCLYSTDYYNNAVDACYEIIVKLHEQKIL